MQIANPIYDVVFKYLMEDNDSAKLLISTIIGEEVEELELLPQERVTRMEREYAWERESQQRSLTVYRLDFSAKIKTPDGSKSVLIEIQKAKFASDIMRFRKYLGEQYIKKMHEGPLPIVTIYFLGYALDYTDAPVIKVNRTYHDLTTNKEIDIKEDFIEKLTHNSYVIQIPYLNSSHKSDLEKLLAVFDQRRCLVDDNHMLNIEEESVPRPYRRLVRRLLRAASEPQVRDTMDIEDEVLEELEGLERRIEEKDKRLEEKDRVIEARDRALKENKEELEKNKKELEENKKELEEKERMIEELLKKLDN